MLPVSRRDVGRVGRRHRRDREGRDESQRTATHDLLDERHLGDLLGR